MHTTGFGITLDLPVFTRNRGQIAVQRATREQLHAEYQARLDQAAGESDRLWQQQGLLEAQSRAIAAHLPSLERMVHEARDASDALIVNPAGLSFGSIPFLDALAVEKRPNMPGTTTQWPNWRIALPKSLENVRNCELVAKVARALRGPRVK